MMSDDERRHWFVEASLSRTTHFRWTSSAVQLEHVYRRVGAELA
jgi:hypothetical protein